MHTSALHLLMGTAFIMMLMAKVVPAQDETISIASAKFVLDPNKYILDSTTIAPGSAGVSIDGQVVSADPANDLFVNGVEVLTGYLATTVTSGTASVSTTVSSASTMSVIGNGTSGSASSRSQKYGTVSISTTASTSRLVPSSTTSIPDSGTLVPGSSTGTGLSVGNLATSVSTSTGSFTHGSGIQSNYSTGSSISATRGTSLASNGTSSGLSSASTQIPTVYPPSATAPTAYGSSGTTSSAALGSSNAGSTIPGSITSGPAIAMPVTTINPTGTVASAAGISLGALIFGISQEASTLSAIVTNSASSSSYVLKIEAVESKWNGYFKDIGGENPPTYDTTCTGGGLTGLLKLVGCIISGLDKIKTGIEGIDIDNPTPELTEIEDVIANVADITKEEEKEEEDDDDDEQSTQNESQASKTQQSSNVPSASVSSTTVSSSVISSSVSSSAVSSGIVTDPPCDTIVPQAQPAGYSIDNGASEVVLGFVGDILLSVLGSEISGFTTSTLTNSTSAMISSTAIIPSTISSSESTTSASTHPLAGTQSSSSSSATTSRNTAIIPGQGGLSPCAEYLSYDQGYAPGTENFCFCDGVIAPMLSHTVSGTVLSDCSYTIMPTANWTPTVTAGYSSSTPPSSTPPPPTPTPQFNPALTTLLNPFGDPQPLYTI